MTDIDRVSRSLGRVRAELSPTSADKARLRARIMLPAPAPSDGGLGSRAGALAALDAGALTRWVALRATGRLGLALGALVLGTGVAIGFWWGSAQALRSLERSSIAAPVEVAALLAGSTRKRASSGPAPDASGNSSAQQRASAVDAPVQDERGERSRAVAAAPAPAPDVPAPSPRAPPKLDRQKSRAPRTSEPAKGPGLEQEPAPGAGLQQELALLRRVERAIRSSEPVLALALLAMLDERFPETTLSEERLAARRLAECRAGKPDASSSARRFLVEHATSVYRQRIELACGIGEHASERAPMKNAESADTHAR